MKIKKNKVLLITIIFVLFVLCITITSYSLRKDRKLSFPEKSIKDIGVFFGETIYKPVRFFKDTINYIVDKDDIYDEYNELKKEKDNYETTKAELEELKRENKKLKDMLKIDNNLSDYNIINASVVSRDPGYFYSILTIDKGSTKGIKKNMAVTTSEGVIGYIKDVSNYSSTVQLISIKNLKTSISVKINVNEDEVDTGLLTGYDRKKNVYIIEGLSYTGKIKEGTLVTTTGYNKEFPSGLIIGKVKNITTDNFDLARIVEVKPAVNFNDIEYVRIIDKELTK